MLYILNMYNFCQLFLTRAGKYFLKDTIMRKTKPDLVAQPITLIIQETEAEGS